jgi:DNA primase
LSDQGYIDRVREANDIVDYIGEVVKLRRAGGDYAALCPFHDEKTPSFTVSPRKQFFYCFGCGVGGDVIAFAMRYDNLDFGPALEALAKRAGIPPQRPASGAQQRAAAERDQLLVVNRRAQEAFVRWLRGDDRKALEYARRRGLSDELIDRFGLGYAPPAWDSLLRVLVADGISIGRAVAAGLVVPRQGGGGGYDRFRDRLTFPIREPGGEVIAFGGRTLGEDKAKYLNSPESVIFKKGETLFGLDVAQQEIRHENLALCVEGYMDAITLHAYGFGHTVAVLGTALTQSHLHRLKRYSTNLLLLFDGDAAGARAALRALEVTLNEGLTVRVATLPRGHDPDSLLREQGAEGMAACLAAAAPLFEFAVRELLAQAGGRDLASRLRALREILPVGRSLNDAVEQRLFVEHVAAAFELPVERVAAEVAGDSRTAQHGAVRRSPETKARRAVTEAAFGVVWFLSQYPESFEFLQTHRVDVDFPPGPLRDLMTRLLALEQFSEDTLEAGLHARGGELSGELARRVLSDFAQRPDPAASFNDWVHTLRDRRLQREMEEIAARVRRAEAEGDHERARVEQKELILRRVARKDAASLIWQKGQKQKKRADLVDRKRDVD